jgi:hypothetical protein
MKKVYGITMTSANIVLSSHNVSTLEPFHHPFPPILRENTAYDTAYAKDGQTHHHVQIGVHQKMCPYVAI